MKVAELKQVVDANAVEMREGFGRVQEEFGKVREEMRDGFADVRGEMAMLRKEIRDTASETLHQMRMFFENHENNVTLAAEANLEEKIDLKLAKMEVRIERRLEKKLKDKD